MVNVKIYLLKKIYLCNRTLFPSLSHNNKKYTSTVSENNETACESPQQLFMSSSNYKEFLLIPVYPTSRGLMFVKACLFIDLQHTEVNENTDRPSLPEQNQVPSYQRRLRSEVCCQRHQNNQTQASVANTVTDLREQEGMCGAHPPEACLGTMNIYGSPPVWNSHIFL